MSTVEMEDFPKKFVQFAPQREKSLMLSNRLVLPPIPCICPFGHSSIIQVEMGFRRYRL
jgi:hypothetical protein